MFPHNGLTRTSIDQLNEDDKVLILPHHAGLNDFFSTISYLIDVFLTKKIPISNIYCCNTAYDDLRKYFNFELINYVYDNTELDMLKKINVKVFRDHFPSYTNKNISEGLHLTNFIKIRDDVYDKITLHHCKVGVHLRHKATECGLNQTEISKEIEISTQGLNKIFKLNEDKLIYISSDQTKYVEQLSTGRNIILRKSLLCTSTWQFRKNDTLNVVEDIINLSLCDRIYYTAGHFTQLIQTFSNKKIEYIDLRNIS